MADGPQPVPIAVKTNKGVNPSWTAGTTEPTVLSKPSTEPTDGANLPAGPAVTPPLPVPQTPLAAGGTSLPSSPAASLPPSSPSIPPGPAAYVPPAVAVAEPLEISVTIPSIPALAPMRESSAAASDAPAPIPAPELAVVPPPRPPFPWRALNIALGVIVILTLLTAFLWWQGILFGAPRNGLQAVGQMLAALALEDAYHAEGEATIMFQMPPDSDQTSTITLTFRGDRASDTEQQATIGVDLAGLSETLPASLPTALELETRRVDDQLFVRLPILAMLLGGNENQWLELALSDIRQLKTHANVSQLDQARLAAIVTSAERIGYEPVGSIKTAHYKLVLNSAALGELVAGSAADQMAFFDQLASTDLTVDLWLGVKDRLPYRIDLRSSYVGEALTAVTTASLKISTYGQRVAITAPDPSEIRSEGVGSLLATDVASIQMKARDGQRKADLRQMQGALELYRGDHGRYPDSQGKIARSNDRHAALQVLTEQGYLAVLPVDPHDPDQWYGYVSQGGDHYELWSLLENRADPDGQQRDTYYIYLLTDTKAGAEAARSAAPAPPVSVPVSPPACRPSTGIGRLPAGC